MVDQSVHYTVTTSNNSSTPNNSTSAISAAEFAKDPGRYAGQRVSIYGRVTQAVKGAGGFDYYMLDGIVRCQFQCGAHYTEGSNREVNRYVTITGTVLGNERMTASANLVNCDPPC